MTLFFGSESEKKKRHNNRIGFLLAVVIAVSVMFTGCDPESTNSNSDHHYYNDTTGRKDNTTTNANNSSTVVSKVYEVNFQFDYQPTTNIATYSVDVYIDGEYCDNMTKEHILLETWNMKEGSHEIVLKLKKENHPEFNYEEKRVVNITRDTTINCSFKCQFDEIKITEWEVT